MRLTQHLCFGSTRYEETHPALLFLYDGSDGCNSVKWLLNFSEGAPRRTARTVGAFHFKEGFSDTHPKFRRYLATTRLSPSFPPHGGELSSVGIPRDSMESIIYKDGQRRPLLTSHHHSSNSSRTSRLPLLTTPYNRSITNVIHYNGPQGFFKVH